MFFPSYVKGANITSAYWYMWWAVIWFSQVKDDLSPWQRGCSVGCWHPCFKGLKCSHHCHFYPTHHAQILRTMFIRNEHMFTTRGVFMEDLKQELLELINKLTLRQLQYLVAFVKVYFKLWYSTEGYLASGISFAICLRAFRSSGPLARYRWTISITSSSCNIAASNAACSPGSSSQPIK